MLASTGAVTGDGWAFEPKLDGWRALVYLDEGVRVRTRRGSDVSDACPQLAALADAVEGRAVLDGELVVGDGRPESFYALGGRMARRRFAWAAERLTFAVFDVLVEDGEPVFARPYVERRAILAGLVDTGPAWCVVPAFDDDGGDVFDVCERLGLEGVVAKRLSSPYRPGERSRDWLKAKTPVWRAEHAPRRHERRFGTR